MYYVILLTFELYFIYYLYVILFLYVHKSGYKITFC
jgi:hypothetical protein